MPITEATLLSFHKQGTKNNKLLFLKIKIKIYDKQRNVKSYWKTASIY